MWQRGHKVTGGTELAYQLILKQGDRWDDLGWAKIITKASTLLGG